MAPLKGDSADPMVPAVAGVDTAPKRGIGVSGTSDHGTGIYGKGGSFAGRLDGEALVTHALYVGSAPLLLPNNAHFPPTGIELNPDTYTLTVRNKDGAPMVLLGTAPQGAGGRLELCDKDGQAALAVGTDDHYMVLRNSAGTDNVWIHADPSNGGSGIDLRDQAGCDSIVLSADGNALVVKNKVGVDNVWIHADPTNGGSGIHLRDQAGCDSIVLFGDHHTLVVKNKAGVDNVWIHADPTNGGSGIDLRDQANNTTIQIDGDAGDIRLLNADCAEEFQAAGSAPVEPGTVMVFDDHGRLEPGTAPYDRRVAGVVSGAGDLRPGLILGRQAGRPDRLPIALIGQVYCKVDADLAPIRVGDLLTTSGRPGHAMRALDPAQAFGAVLGKALQPLAQGTGLIPILAALQ